MTARTALATALLTASLVPSAGCWLSNPDTPVLEAEDVTMEVGDGRAFRSSGVQGDAYTLAVDVSENTNAWVVDVAVGMSHIVRELNRYPEDHTDGEWRVYGPHDDENGKDGSWMAKIQGDELGSSFEVYIGRRGASPDQMSLLIDGGINVDDDSREGTFTIDFDTIHDYADIIDDARQDARYGGKISVTFERSLEDLTKHIEMDFDGFYFNDGWEDANFDGEHYTYLRAGDGSGQFHFGARSSFDSEGWSGPEQERMLVDMSWTANNDGRARGQIVEVEGEGDLRYGDIVLHECFDSEGSLTWRDLNEEYAVHEPGYNFGDEETCVLTEGDLEIPG